MSKVLIVYGSTTGQTELASEHVEKGLKNAGLDDLEVMNVLDIEAEELNNYDKILFGCSTWDLGALQYDFQPFFESMQDVDLSGKKAAVFGCGDKSYGETYCQAVDKIEELLKAKDVNLVAEGLKIDGDLHDENIEKIEKWAEETGKVLE